MWDKWTHSATLHTTIDYVFLCVIASCNCAPFIGINYLLDRRRDCHVALRPLLASRSMGKDGIKVRVMGNAHDPIYQTLTTFLANLGHLADEEEDDTSRGQEQQQTRQPVSLSSSSAGDRESTLNLRSFAQSSRSLYGGTKRVARCVTVHVIDSLAHRDELFGPRNDASVFDNRFSLFIWSGFSEAKGTMPFTDDAIGQRLMRYLVVVAAWEKHGLAEALFSAIGVRVTDILHERPSADALMAKAASFRHSGSNKAPSTQESELRQRPLHTA
jgi:hypothetical protein